MDTKSRVAIKRGVMVMKDGKAWGITYEDGHVRCYGWVEPVDAPIYNPQCCKQPTDVTWRGSPYTEELMTGKLVAVERRTEVTILLNASNPDSPRDSRKG